MVAVASLRTDDLDAPTAAAGRPRRGSRRLLPVIRIAAENGVDVCGHCEVADRALGRMRGLLGRRGLEPDHGMLITPAPSVMTFFMRFPIDVVFLDRDRRIVGISPHLGPWRVAGARRAAAALELPAGTAADRGLRKGDLLLFGEPEPPG
jgi:uncharacterized membrane protein (UPF0127 family)